METEHLLILANLAVCSLGGWICLCRMAKMSHSETKLEIRIQYTIWFALFSASSWSFALLGEWVSVIQFLMSCGILTYLAIGVPAWRWEAPEYSKRESA